MESLLECSNIENVRISMAEIYCYHAILTLGTYINIPVKDFWKKPELFSWDPEILKLTNLLSFNRYTYIRSKLKGDKQEDLLNLNRPASVKVKRPLNALQETLRKTVSHPDEFLSADEGMAKGSVSHLETLLYLSLGNAKPLEGFRFFIYYDIS